MDSAALDSRKSRGLQPISAQPASASITLHSSKPVNETPAGKIRVVDPQILAAVVSGAAALVVALVALIQSKRNQTAQSDAALKLEELRADIATKRSEADARQDCEYEARKRLYTEVSPLLFQLSELSDAARHEMRRLCDESNWVRLAMTDSARESLTTRGWIGSTAYDTVVAAYALLAPLASYRLIQRRMVFLDLTLDRRISVQWAIMRAVYESFYRDEDIAALGDPLAYNPRVEGWRHRRRSEPRTYWWQGVTRGRLDNAIQFIAEGEGPNAPRLLTFGEFETRFKTVASKGGEGGRPLVYLPTPSSTSRQLRGPCMETSRDPSGSL